MLAKSNGAAGERLRRAKSTSSAHISSGDQRSTVQVDPFVTRHHAEAAAVEAYNRAKQYERATYQAYRSVPPKLQRRRSQISGRSEGSHFEDARLGRRRSTATKDEGIRTESCKSVDCHKPLVHTNMREGDTVITRKRSVIEPFSSSSAHAATNHLSVPQTGRYARRTPSAYMDGSPAPRYSRTPRERSSNFEMHTPSIHAGDEQNEHASKQSKLDASKGDVAQTSSSGLRGTRETQTDEDIIAMARDRCLLDFQQRKVRERKSLLFAPVQKLQKRAVTAMYKATVGASDRTLPPFNHASEDSGSRFPAKCGPLPQTGSTTAKSGAKNRNFSDSMKGRFKKMFCKAPRAPSGLPAQHVEAKRIHYPVEENDDLRGVQLRDGSDPFHSFSSKTPSLKSVPNDPHTSTISKEPSIADDTTAQSRVTSWTNSTIAGTLTSHAGTERLPAATEHGALRRSDSVFTLRKKGALLSRSISNRLRRPSKGEMRSSEESQRLYSALQQRLNSPGHEGQSSIHGTSDSSPAADPPSELERLPSEQLLPVVEGNPYGWVAPTIRAVTPDPAAYKMMSPVLEMPSPDTIVDAGRTPMQLDLPRPGLQFQKSPVAQPPSQAQIAQRLARSQNRWQAPLDELSPHPDRASWMEDNPYELRSLSHSVRPDSEPEHASGLPHHVRTDQEIVSNGPTLLSPSVYSRATDGASPRPDTPMEEAPMMVTITSREVKRYPLFPPKGEKAPAYRPVRGSRDWRKWLSDETRGFESLPGPKALLLPQSALGDVRPTEMHVKSGIRPEHGYSATNHPAVGNEGRQASSSSSPRVITPVEATDARPRTISSRRSSFMNERYPMVETSRESSVSINGKALSQVGKQSSSVEAQNEEPSSTRHSILNRQRPVPKHRRSVAQMDSAARTESAFASCVTQQNDLGRNSTAVARPSLTTTDTTQSAPSNMKTSTRPRSAFDLRANYRSRAASTARPLEVRRTAINNANNILEDTTVQNIAAGPYARENKENTPPPSSPLPVEDGGLPALSSAEWLGGPINKKRDSGRTVARRPSAYAPASKGLPQKTSGHGGTMDGSPGQRIATQWLQERGGSKENSPAFV